jgi:ABC-type transport system substrate-binding protein
MTHLLLRALSLGLMVGLLIVGGMLPAAAAPAKVLRVSMISDVNSFDPARTTDIYSQKVSRHILESLYTYDYLARPLKVKPLTAAALPEVADNFRQFTIRVKPGIFFADDPAFGGKPRELVAEDYVYSIKRHFDPRTQSAHHPDLAELQIRGLEALYQHAVKTGQPFDYDAPVEGLRALDRYTLRIQLDRPAPRLIYNLTADPTTAALAREVVQAQGEHLGEHPVGTGPFRLVQWRRGSLLVLERNPGFREMHYAEQAAPGDARASAVARSLAGRRLPMLDRVEVAIMEEDQPIWLSFLRGDQDLTAVPSPFVPQAVPGGRPSPLLTRRGIEAQLTPQPDVIFTYFNMDDPMVGGYSPAQVALRRAIGLGYDNEEEIRVLRRTLAVPAQSIVPPLTYGYDAALKSEMSEYAPSRAKALLDLYGFVDRNGDGWRERPDGSPLQLSFHTDKTLRPYNELWKRRMDALGIRIQFLQGQWSEQQKAARAGALMMWFLAWNAGSPDSGDFFGVAFGKAKGAQNLSRFDLPAYNALYEQIDTLPDGPERLRVMAEAKRLLLAYLPFKAHVHRIGVQLNHPWVIGFLPNVFLSSDWTFLDVDAKRQAAR